MPAKKPAPAKKAPAKKAPAKAKIVVPTTKAAILAEVATKAGITKKQAEDAYATLLAIAYAGAKLPAGITLPGLVKLSIGKRAARVARNPRTGAEIKVPAAKVVKAKVLKALKDGAL
jgi:DNA-binding protein HU-beta